MITIDNIVAKYSAFTREHLRSPNVLRCCPCVAHAYAVAMGNPEGAVQLSMRGMKVETVDMPGCYLEMARSA